MNLPIIQSILHGALRPNISSDIPFQAITRKFNNLPFNLAGIENLYKAELCNYAMFDFEKTIPINNIAPDNYTPIIEYTFMPNVELPFTELQQTPQFSFYNTIVKAETTRIKLALLSFSESAQSDIDTKQEVKETLQQIKSYTKSAADISDSIFQKLQTHLIKLYFELTLMFDVLLTENDFTPFDDFFLDCFNQYPTIEQANAYKATKIIQQTQIQTSKGLDISEAQTMLSEFSQLLTNQTQNTTITKVAIALENYIYLNCNNQAIPTFEQLINTEFVNLIIKEQKNNFKQRFEREEVALDRANVIDEIITELPVTINQQNPLSIVSNLTIFLNQQKDIYLKYPSALFKVVIEKQSNELKKKPQPTIKPMQIKTKLAIANKHLAFLNGVNPKNNERIMSESDYKLLVGYVEYLIQNGSIPKITRKIPRANLQKTWFRYTLYLIHQELYSSIQDIWIEFMQAAFIEFSSNIVEFSTIKTKFSQSPSGYNQFIKQVLG
ncbi:MAG: hypothetical protein M0P66_00515 [Salinivirgaceae bacterium]|nr:hypothetical protein [Salinivirgaceae bacterium]